MRHTEGKEELYTQGRSRERGAGEIARAWLQMSRNPGWNTAKSMFFFWSQSLGLASKGRLRVFGLLPPEDGQLNPPLCSSKRYWGNTKGVRHFLSYHWCSVRQWERLSRMIYHFKTTHWFVSHINTLRILEAHRLFVGGPVNVSGGLHKRQTPFKLNMKYQS